MKLIINADDYGLTGGICRNIVALFDKDAISNTSVMICVEGAVARCKLLRDSGHAHRAGVHLQATAENHHRTPLSDPRDIPSLVDANGQFPMRDHLGPINLEELEHEWNAQILKTIEALGTKPSHLDSHHGLQRIPELAPVYLKLAAKYDLPVRGGTEIGQVDGSSYGVKVSALCDNGWTGKDAPLDVLKDRITKGLSLCGDGVLELITHPGFVDDDLMKSSTWNTVRENDHAVLLELAESKWLEEQGIQMVKYPEMV